MIDMLVSMHMIKTYLTECPTPKKDCPLKRCKKYKNSNTGTTLRKLPEHEVDKLIVHHQQCYYNNKQGDKKDER